MEKIIHVCHFKRNVNDKMELGIRIGEGGTIIDLSGKVVNEVYHSFSCFEEGSFVIFEEEGFVTNVPIQEKDCVMSEEDKTFANKVKYEGFPEIVLRNAEIMKEGKIFSEAEINTANIMINQGHQKSSEKLPTPKFLTRPKVEVYSKDECVFQYCPNPEICKKKGCQCKR